MTYEELKEIKQRLDIWREQRHLSYESQQKGFMPNVLEELREYYLAKDDDERVAELCDVVIFCLNVNELSFTFFEEIARQDNGENVEDVLLHLRRMMVGETTFSFSDVVGTRVIQHLSLYAIIFICENVAKKLGYNFCECLKEKVKEIESRTGHYDESLGKFVKDIGAYSLEQAEKIAKEQCFKKIGHITLALPSLEKNNDYFYFDFVWRENGKDKRYTEKIKKWHKAKMVRDGN